MATNTPSTKTEFKCPECSRAFPHQKGLDMHIRLMHQPTKRRRTGKLNVAAAASLQHRAGGNRAPINVREVPVLTQHGPGLAGLVSIIKGAAAQVDELCEQLEKAGIDCTPLRFMAVDTFYRELLANHVEAEVPAVASNSHGKPQHAGVH